MGYKMWWGRVFFTASLVVMLFLTGACPEKEKERQAPVKKPAPDQKSIIEQVEQSLARAEQAYKQDPNNDAAKRDQIKHSLQLGNHYEKKKDDARARQYYEYENRPKTKFVAYY